MTESILSVKEVSFGFPGCPVFLGPVSLEIHSGDVVGIIGPNGAGKSTLLKIMAGLLESSAGSVSLEGTSLTHCSRRVRSQHVAYLPQKPESPQTASALEVVLAGRYARRAFGLFESAHDESVVRDVMRLTDTQEYADRAMDTLSGGEAQRVFLASALSGEPRVLLLDEPTTALDLRHQRHVLTILRNQAESGGLAVVMVLHDVNHASQFCNKVLLLNEGGVAGYGSTESVLDRALLENVYRIRFSIHQQDGSRWLLPLDSI